MRQREATSKVSKTVHCRAFEEL